MSTSLLVRMRQNEARVIDESFAERMAARHFDGMAREGQAAITACLDYPDIVRAEWRCVGREIWDLVQRREPVDWLGLGGSMQEMFDSSMEVLNALRRWVQSVEEAGGRVNNAESLEETIDGVTSLRSEVLDGWPWPPSPEEITEAMAEFEHGDSLPLDEAFAEIAGVSKEEWLAKVEAYQRKRQEEDDALGRPRIL